MPGRFECTFLEGYTDKNWIDSEGHETSSSEIAPESMTNLCLWVGRTKQNDNFVC